ncbi:MAG: LytTR family DNA-binding domain-containing protein [Bacteroidota bacterium]
MPEQRILTKDKIGEFEHKLPAYFLRIHRSYIVNIRKITAYTKQDVEIGQNELPIGVSYKREVIAFLQRV